MTVRVQPRNSGVTVGDLSREQMVAGEHIVGEYSRGMC